MSPRAVVPPLLLLAAACGEWASNRTLTPEERRTVDAWLVCEDCMDGELDSVLALAARKRRVTLDALTRDLLAGPAPERRNHIERQLAGTYLRIRTYASDHHGAPPALDSARFVSLFRDNTVDLYRKRAALALARVDGVAALPVLDSVRDGHYLPPGDSIRPDVAAAVSRLIDQLQPQ